MPLCSMADLQRRCAVQNLTIAINVRVDFRKANCVITQDSRDSTLKCLMTLLPSFLRFTTCTVTHTGIRFAADGVVSPLLGWISTS